MGKLLSKIQKLFNAVKGQKKMKPPVAKKIPHEIEQFNEKRIDNYHWMRDADWQTVLKDPSVLTPEIREYLEAENAYTKEQFKSGADLTKAIGDELAARLVPTETSVPVKDGDWEYWDKFEEGADYPIHMRRDLKTQRETVIFDENIEAAGHEFFDVSSVSHSPDHKYIAYAVDTEGSEHYDIRIRDLETGTDFTETLPKTAGYVAWAADSSAFYYIESDDAHRPKKVKQHVLGTDSSQDKEIYHEVDDAFFLNVSKSLSGEYIFIQSSDSETSETRVFKSSELQNPKPELIRAREMGVQYEVLHHENDFYIHTNIDGATEFKLMRTPVDQTEDTNWVDVVPARDDVTIEDIIVFKDYMVRIERENALKRVVVSDYKGGEFKVGFPDDAYVMSASSGYEQNTDKLRVYYQTMAQPGRVFEVDLNDGSMKTLKEKKLPNGHDPSNYIVERLMVTADDGVDIPVTTLRHKSVKADGSAPLYQYGYGSYGMSVDPSFSSTAISMADRGIVYAIAHVRGGGANGEKWHKTGKKLSKKNTFTDFVKITEALIKKGYGKKGEVAMEGRSAGGMLMGAVVNLRPDLYGAVIAGVPFVDVLNTISDPSLPLTPPEWEEWGNPIKDKNFFDYMKSYSPYENIKKGQTYPMIVAPAGLTDPRVTYWEPAKWIARLRDEAKGGPFLLKMNMGSGHFGSMARYERVREHADEYAAILQRWVDKGYDLTMRVKYPTYKAPKPTTPKTKK